MNPENVLQFWVIVSFFGGSVCGLSVGMILMALFCYSSRREEAEQKALLEQEGAL
jgi:hypothetical protein